MSPDMMMVALSKFSRASKILFVYLQLDWFQVLVLCYQGAVNVIEEN